MRHARTPSKGGDESGVVPRSDCLESSAGRVRGGRVAAGRLSRKKRRFEPFGGAPPTAAEHARGQIELQFKAAVLYPARDILLLDPLWRVLFGSPARNTDRAGGVAPGSFLVDLPSPLVPERVALPAGNPPPPLPPFAIRKVRKSGRTPSFIGTDALGRKFLFKLDDPEYPELATGATIIGSRVLAALGYRVPAEFLVHISGTGDARFDGRRATASLFIDGVAGAFSFDWFRQRRELRGLRLASAWINDTDRVSSNTIVAVEAGEVRMYMIDFDSCLGSWQGRPKEGWRGWRHEWDLGAAIGVAATLGIWQPQPRAAPIQSPATGRLDNARFDPLQWRTQVPNNAFEHMDEQDGRWICARIAALSRAHIDAIVAAAQFSRPEDAQAIAEYLWNRRARILALYPD